jgi:hypothetical protein
MNTVVDLVVHGECRARLLLDKSKNGSSGSGRGKKVGAVKGCMGEDRGPVIHHRSERARSI